MRALFWALLLPGCALFAKTTPQEIRYFLPERVNASTASSPREEGAAPLRLGHFTSSANLRYRIVHRDSDFEMGEYESLRWTDDPEVYVRRALVRALFEERPLKQEVVGAPPTLDVDVVVFEEVRRGAHRAGRVELRYQLQHEGRILASGLVTRERSAESGAAEPVVAAIAGAMDDAASDVATAVASRLAGSSGPTVAPGPKGHASAP